MNRSCQRQTHIWLVPVQRMISPVPHLSAVAGMIFTH